MPWYNNKQQISMKVKLNIHNMLMMVVVVHIR